MKNLTKQFLSEADQDIIIATVKEAEKTTAGEIVPMVVSSSYHYPLANIIGGMTFALPISVILTHIVGKWFWMGSQNMWLFMAMLFLTFIISHEIIKRLPRLKRLFLSAREINEEVEEAATTNFFKEGLHKTKDETGILIFISVFEQKVWILADQGINDNDNEGTWDEIVKTIVDGIKLKQQGRAISEAVKKVGHILKEHFPVQADDTDELKNLILKDQP